MDYLFEAIYESNRENYQSILLPRTLVQQVDAFVRAVVDKKLSESEHKMDYAKTYSRFYTGYIGEGAIELLLGHEFVDWSVGHSSKYSYADLRPLGLDIGIKTVEYGKFPLVSKRSRQPQIINVMTKMSEIVICGFAPIKVIKKYSSDELVLDNRALDRKTAFYGFHMLEYFENIEDLRTLIHK